MHFPATFPVAPVSIVPSHVCHPSFQSDISARRLCWGGEVARGGRAPAGKDADRAHEWKGISGQGGSDTMWTGVFSLRHYSQTNLYFRRRRSE